MFEKSVKTRLALVRWLAPRFGAFPLFHAGPKVFDVIEKPRVSLQSLISPLQDELRDRVRMVSPPKDVPEASKGV